MHALFSLNEEDSVFNGALSCVTRTIMFVESPYNRINRCCVCENWSVGLNQLYTPCVTAYDLSIANGSLGNMGDEADAHNVKCKFHTVRRDEGAKTSVLILWFGSIGMNSSINTSSPACELATSAACALMVLQSVIA